MTDIAHRKQITRSWFESLRDRICADFEKIEGELTGTHAELPAAKFERTAWQRPREADGQDLSRLHRSPRARRSRSVRRRQLAQAAYRNGAIQRVIGPRCEQRAGRRTQHNRSETKRSRNFR